MPRPSAMASVERFSVINAGKQWKIEPRIASLLRVVFAIHAPGIREVGELPRGGAPSEGRWFSMKLFSPTILLLIAASLTANAQEGPAPPLTNSVVPFRPAPVQSLQGPIVPRLNGPVVQPLSGPVVQPLTGPIVPLTNRGLVPPMNRPVTPLR